MKKCLWMTAAAMVLGWGMSAQAAVTGAVYSAWSFETLGNGTVIPSTDDSQLGAPYDTWSASSNNDDLAYVTNNGSIGPFSFGDPINSGTHTNVLYFNSTDGVTNHYNGITLYPQQFFTDFLLKPGALEEETLLAKVDVNARLAFYFTTNGVEGQMQFNLISGGGNLGTGGGTVATTRFATVYGTGDWVRVTINQNYADTADLNRAMFSVWVNGTNLVHANAFTIGNSPPGDWIENGTNDVWFYMISAPNDRGMSALVALGVGLLDDVVNTATDPFGGGSEPSFITVLAMSTNNAYGTISPAGFVTITDGVARAFTLTVVDGVAAYVTGLKVDGAQIATNTDTGVKTQVWNVSYAQVGGALGTNVVAMFASKPDTTAAKLNIYFTIDPNGSGPLNYTSFALANADDWDHDGFSNFDEAVAGTDPTDVTDFLKISSITVDAAGQVVVTFEGSAAALAANYNLMEADTVDQVPYSNVVVRAKDGGTLSVTNTPASSPKFYKVVVPYSGE